MNKAKCEEMQRERRKRNGNLSPPERAEQNAVCIDRRGPAGTLPPALDTSAEKKSRK